MAVGHSVISSDMQQSRKRSFRPWLERGLFIALVGAILTYHFGSGRQACVVAIDGRPVVVMTSRRAAEQLLDSFREQAGNIKGAEFARPVTLHVVPAAGNHPVSEVEAMKALAPRLTLVVPAAGIFVNGKLLAGLPDRTEAVTTLSLLLSELSPRDPDLTRAFREGVSIQDVRVTLRSYLPNAQVVLDRVRRAMTATTNYVVQSGDSLWKIADQHHVTTTQVRRANPNVDFAHLKAGDELEIPQGRSPVTVVAWKEVLEPVGNPSGGKMQTVRIVYENGAEVERYVIQRPRHSEPEQPRTRSHRHRSGRTRPAVTEEPATQP